MPKLNNTKFGTSPLDNLFTVGKQPTEMDGVNLKSGQGVVKRGTVLGIITASGQAVPVNSAANDGSQVPHSVLSDTTDTGADTNAAPFPVAVYITGNFNTNKLIFGGTDTAARHVDKLRERGIFLAKNLAY